MKNKIFLAIILSFPLFAVNVFAMQYSHSFSAKTDCALETGTCVKTIGTDNVQVEFDINPKPVTTMSDLVFTVTVKKDERPVTDAKVGLDLTMPGMFMGVNRHVLSHVKDGRYEGKGVLPVCPHGGVLWKAEVTVERDGRSATVSYIFEVK
ncbi:MAG: FixH family protein [Nitrospirae bacterium]|nr:FixH family protein [Nitrospirota bacterium]